MEKSQIYYIADQNLAKLFYGPCENPPPPSFMLNVRSLI